jgi:transposase
LHFSWPHANSLLLRQTAANASPGKASASRHIETGSGTAATLPRPIARGIAGPGLIAQIVVAKFGDHLPLYRQEDFFTRHGLHVPRSTLCDWVQASAGRLLFP